MSFGPGSRVSLFLVLVLAGVGGARLAQAAVKLFLKDGTYQLVESYEVRGDKVRYYSVERSEWEEMPASLVDFKATQRAQQEEKASQKQREKEAQDIDKERFEREANAGFEISAGIRLPREEGIFAFDGERVIRLVQSSGEIVTDKKRAALLLALPGPVLKNRSLVVLRGAKAAVRISAPQPTFYVQFSDGAGARVELLAVKPSKEARVVEKIESRAGLGKPDESRSALAVERTEVVAGLFKLRPVQALPPGEYVLGELVEQHKLNLNVWDFGIERSVAK